MATYVFSDVHGHLAPLLRAFDEISPTEDDRFYMLGDMVDRGPDPVGVMRFCHSLPNTVVLRGNHESLMLDCMNGSNSGLAWYNWILNGGHTTALGMLELKKEEERELVSWVAGLPLSATVRVGNRDFILVHAGMRPNKSVRAGNYTPEELDALLATQTEEDLVWIRREHWGQPTGLLNNHGEGPIVISGHTPTVVVEVYADCCDRPARNDDDLCQMLALGACEDTGGVPDRLAIDCGAGSVPDSGRVMVLRLDDGKEFYQSVGKGE